MAYLNYNLYYNYNLLANPLEQFNLTSIIKITPFTNMDLYLFYLVILTYLLNLNLNLTVPFYLKLYLNFISHNSFGIIDTIIDSITGAIISLRSEFYLIILYSLFILILTSNVIGLIPYTFTVTSYFTITISLSLAIIATFTIISILRNGKLFINSFIPTGTPLTLAPLLLIIETLSYTGRSISLGTRLAANILAGHSLLHIITEFTILTYNINNSFNIYFVSLLQL